MTPQIISWCKRVRSELSLTPGKVLEIGSRKINSTIRDALQPDATDYIGVDSEPGECVDFVVDAEHLLSYFPEQHFNTVTCMETLEHTIRPWRIVAVAKKLLAPNGHLWISTPTFGFPLHHPEGVVDCYRFGTDAYRLWIYRNGLILRMDHLTDDIGQPCIAAVGTLQGYPNPRNNAQETCMTVLLFILWSFLLMLRCTVLTVAAQYFYPFLANIGLKTMNLNSDTLNLALFVTGTTPTTADGTFDTATTHQLNSSGATEVANGNGYTAGGAAIGSTAYSQSGGTATLTGTPATPTWTASSSGFSFQYVVVYSTTAATSATRPLIQWYDYGSNLTLPSGATFTVTFASGIFTLTHA